MLFTGEKRELQVAFYIILGQLSGFSVDFEWFAASIRTQIEAN